VIVKIHIQNKQSSNGKFKREYQHTTDFLKAPNWAERGHFKLEVCSDFSQGFEL